MHDIDIPDALEIRGRHYNHTRHGDLSIVVDDDGAALMLRTADGGSRLTSTDDVVRLLASGVARPAPARDGPIGHRRPIRSLRHLETTPCPSLARPVGDIAAELVASWGAPAADGRADEALTWAAFVHLTSDAIDVMDAYALYLDALVGLHGGFRVPARLVASTSALRRRIAQVRRVLGDGGATIQ